jgi:hypothetical protein
MLCSVCGLKTRPMMWSIMRPMLCYDHAAFCGTIGHDGARWGTMGHRRQEVEFWWGCSLIEV